MPDTRKLAASPFHLAVIALLAATMPARAAVLSTTPTLPLIGAPLVAAIGAGCFPAAGLCVLPGSFTRTGVIASGFNPDGQANVSDFRSVNGLTTLLGAPLGTLSLLGTLTEEVFGRSSPNATGSWATEITALSLSGSFMGRAVTLTLDPARASTGTASVTPIQTGAPGFGELRYLITETYDAFVRVAFAGPVPLMRDLGPISLQAVAVPEPPMVGPFVAALIGLGMAAGALAKRGAPQRR